LPASERRTRLADVPDSHITQNAVTVTNDEKIAAEWLYSNNQSITTSIAAKCADLLFAKRRTKTTMDKIKTKTIAFFCGTFFLRLEAPQERSSNS